MLSSAYEATSWVRSLPMSTSQPPGVSVGTGIGLPAPSGPAGVVIGPPVPSAPVMSAPGSGQLISGVLKNGTGLQGMEEEVISV